LVLAASVAAPSVCLAQAAPANPHRNVTHGADKPLNLWERTAEYGYDVRHWSFYTDARMSDVSAKQTRIVHALEAMEDDVSNLNAAVDLLDQRQARDSAAFAAWRTQTVFLFSAGSLSAGMIFGALLWHTVQRSWASSSPVWG
jgi:hypothetical protein